MAAAASSVPLPTERNAPGRVDWPASALALWARMEAHELDVPGAALPFCARLARDNHWGADYARRVVDEYKRFCFLACVTDHPVTPSDQVDQAWHLHLLYTEDYWRVFCPEVLCRDLHHGPTRGGADEGRRFDEQYARTRHSYLRWFGEHPPVDVWSIATERFGRDTRFTRANRDDYWLVPRPRALWRRVRAQSLSALLVPVLLLVLLVMALGPWAGTAEARGDDRPSRLVDAGYDPYALAAGPFLLFFAGACAAVACAATLSSFARSRAHGAGRGLGVAPGVYTAALLAGGPSRALLTALTQLVAAGHLTIGTGGSVIAYEPPPESDDGLDRAVFGVAQRGRSVRALRSPSGALRTALERVEQNAERDGLLLSSGEIPRLEMFVAALFPVALAAPRIALALPASRPIGFLVALTIGFAVIGAIMTRRVRTRLTEGGRRYLERLKEHPTAQAGSAVQANGDDLVWATAAFGTTILAGTALGDVHTVARQQIAPPKTDGGWGSSGCGGGGCGGGGCGGGGCGG